MANIVPVSTQVNDETGQFIGWNVQWGPMANGDVGVPVQFAHHADRTVQIEAMPITGSFGAGGTLVFEGSNTGVNYYPLTNPQGVPLVITAAGISEITEVVRFARPHVTGGDGTTSLQVTMFFRRLRFP